MFGGFACLDPRWAPHTHIAMVFPDRKCIAVVDLCNEGPLVCRDSKQANLPSARQQEQVHLAKPHSRHCLEVSVVQDGMRPPIRPGIKLQKWLSLHVAGVVTGRQGTASKRKATVPARLPVQTLATNDDATGPLVSWTPHSRFVLMVLVPVQQEPLTACCADAAVSAGAALGISPQPMAEASLHVSDAASTAPDAPSVKKVWTTEPKRRSCSS